MLCLKSTSRLALRRERQVLPNARSYLPDRTASHPSRQ